MKTSIILFTCALSTQSIAGSGDLVSDKFLIKPPNLSYKFSVNELFSDVDLLSLLPAHKVKEIGHQSVFTPEYFSMCDHSGDYYTLTPDAKLEMNYRRGWLTHIATFTATNNVTSYTPIRDIINAPQRAARFSGYYFVSQ